jgi:hypothetical protein
MNTVLNALRYSHWTDNDVAEVRRVTFLTDYPFWDLMGTMLIFFIWVIWLWLLFTVFIDIFRRHDIGGWSKAIWVVFLVVLPYIGVLVYLIVEHQGMAERQAKQVQQAQAQTDEYIRSVSSQADPTEQIAKAKALLDAGTITQEEFDALKAKALA